MVSSKVVRTGIKVCHMHCLYASRALLGRAHFTCLMVKTPSYPLIVYKMSQNIKVCQFDNYMSKLTAQFAVAWQLVQEVPSFPEAILQCIHKQPQPPWRKQSLLYGGKLWRVQILAKWQGKHHWRNKLWQIDDESLIKCILKQFEDTSAPNLSIRAHVCACMLLDNDVGWLLSFLAESKIGGYHERNWSVKGNREIHTIRIIKISKCHSGNAILSSSLANFESLSRSQCYK